MTSKTTGWTPWLPEKSDTSRVPTSVQNRTNNHLIAVIHNAIYHISALALPSTLPCIPTSFPNIHMPGQAQINVTFPSKWQDRSDQKTLSPPFTLPHCQRLRVELVSCFLQTCYKCIWAATSLERSYLVKCSQVYCEIQISRYAKIPPSLSVKKKYTWFYLRQTLPGTYIYITFSKKQLK